MGVQLDNRERGDLSGLHGSPHLHDGRIRVCAACNGNGRAQHAGAGARRPSEPYGYAGTGEVRSVGRQRWPPGRHWQIGSPAPENLFRIVPPRGEIGTKRPNGA